VKIKCWGVRGSIASPGINTAIYGGNTSCYEVIDDDNNCFIFDAGTGIRALGNDLIKRKINNIHLFISHTHWDHIQGFPFFVPSYIPGTKIHIYGPTHFEKKLKSIMDLQMDYTYFPISMQQLNASFEYTDLKEETFTIGNTQIVTKYSNHPVTALCYKVICNNKTVVYTGDFEPYYNVLKDKGETAKSNDDFDDDFAEDEDMDSIVLERNEHHKKFCIADVLIHDAQYTAEEYPKFQGWGHSPQEHVIDMAKTSGVKKLLLTHHDPDRTDTKLSVIEKHLQDAHKDLDLRFTREGMEIEI